MELLQGHRCFLNPFLNTGRSLSIKEAWRLPWLPRPWCPVADSPLQCRKPGFDPWSQSWISHSTARMEQLHATAEAERDKIDSIEKFKHQRRRKDTPGGTAQAKVGISTRRAGIGRGRAEPLALWCSQITGEVDCFL